MSGSRSWAIETFASDARSLHAAELPARRGLWLMNPTRPAFVLGSSQDEGDIDGGFCSAHGIDVVRRRSGGGAVHVDSAASVWIDIVIPRDDALWVDDVGRAMHFVGLAWRQMLVDFGVSGTVVNEGPHVANDWSKTLCVAGRGAGEVFRVSGAKVVGISQRRTRDFARFQCIAYHAWDITAHLGAIPLLNGDPERAATLVATMPAVEPADLVVALASALPTH
jgi:lipoate-protein ligase A